MEALIVLGLGAVGYWYNNESQQQQPAADQPVRRARTDTAALRPNDRDPYDTKVLLAARTQEAHAANTNYAKATDPWATGVVPRFMNENPGAMVPPGANFAPVGAVDSGLMGSPLVNRVGPVPPGPDGVQPFHNNMVPFFGGRIKQNMSEAQNSSVLESFTGQTKLAPRKKEVENMFNPAESRVDNVNGFYEKDRDLTAYKQSLSVAGGLEGIRPFQPVRVGRGLNEGPTSQPTGGFHDMYRPAEITVDDLRVKTNPKTQYEGRILPAKSLADKRQMVVPIAQNRPERVFTQGYGNWLQGAAAVQKNSQRPVFEVKPTARTCSTAYTGPAAPAETRKEESRPMIQADRRNTFCSDGPRNVAAADGWTVKANIEDISDYGRHTFANFDNERTNTECRTVNTNLRGTVARETAQTEDTFRDTRKQAYIINSRKGNVKIKGAKEFPVSNLERMRTTIKETLIHDTRTGNVDMPVKNKTGAHAYNPDEWRARTTLREALENQACCSAKKPVLSGPLKASNYLGDKARTTIRETMDEDGHVGGLSGQHKMTVYDPDDVLRRTLKETLIDATRDGNINASVLQQGRGYMPEEASMEAKNTNRQFTSTVEHFNNAMRDAGQGYATTDYDAPTTLRELTAEYEYEGIAGSTGAKRMTSHEATDNAQVNVFREKTLEGRAPTAEGAKVAAGGDSIIAGCQRVAVEEARRDLAPTKTYQIVTDAGPCQITKDSNKLSSDIPDTRLDPDLLKPLRENPYTIAFTA